MYPTRLSAATSCTVCSQDILQTLRRGFANPCRRKPSDQRIRLLRTSSRSKPILTTTVGVGQRPNTNAFQKRDNARRHVSTHSENALREAVCNLADGITEGHIELEEAFAELEKSDNLPQFSPESGHHVVDAIRDYQKDLEERLLLVPEQTVEEGEHDDAEIADEMADESTEASADPVEDVSSIDPELPLEERRSLIASQLGEVTTESFPEEETASDRPRAHALTAEGKFGTIPSTVFLSQDEMVKPVSEALSKFANKHISQNAHETFGGPKLPKSTSIVKQTSPSPIPLSASQRNMSPMDGNSFLAVLYPGIFASATSVLTELRKRLGAQWLRDLIRKEGGPRVLDVGGGGAGILAWREVVKAEWSVMSPDAPKGSPIPYGKSTVLTASDVLRHRASGLLENTTFIPRLPDYLHMQSDSMDAGGPPPQRKEFDVIIASHSILPKEEDYERKDHVRNLWTMLDPNGGILILVEKGHVNGFDAVAGARQMILDRLVASPNSTEYEDVIESPAADKVVEKEKGMIIAPCTNHEKCPLYVPSKDGKRPNYHCHFAQRYARPNYLQRIIGAADRNHEDVLFSYVAVQRGVDQREIQGLSQDAAATDEAFAGHEGEKDTQNEEATSSDSVTTTESPEPSIPFNPLTVPRIISQPLKRKGHVIMDMCTPAGKIERWVVPRSYSKQAFRDARKSDWGDLWALGAKTRMVREPRVHGTAESDGKQTQRKKPAKEGMTLDDLDDAMAEKAGKEVESFAENNIDIPEFDRTMNKLERPTRRSVPQKASDLPRWKRKMVKQKSKKEMRQTKGSKRSSDF